MLAAKNATTTIPIVMANAADPVALGLVGSLAQPGGNVTGNSSLSPELNTKRLEILKDAVPTARPSWTSAAVGSGIRRKSDLKSSPAATALKLNLEEIVTEPDAKGLEGAFQTAKQKQVGAIMTSGGRLFFAERKRIVEPAGKNRIPAIYTQIEFVEGNLMSYRRTTPTSMARGCLLDKS